MQSLSKMRMPSGLPSSSSAAAAAAALLTPVGAVASVQCEAQKSLPEWSFRQWLCRFSAPISFFSLPAFNDILKAHPIFRFAIVAALLCAISASGVQADAQGAQALAAAAAASASVAGSGSVTDGRVPLASCPTLDTAPADRADTSALPTPLPVSPAGAAADAADSSLVFFPRSGRSDHGAHWRVLYGSTWKLVINEFTGQQFVLVQRGTTPPALVVGQNVTLLGDADEVETITILSAPRQFTVPVRRLCVEETVGLAFVEQLGLRQSVRMLGSGSVPTSACAFSAKFPSLESSWGNLTLRQEQLDADCDLLLGSNGAGPANELQNVPFAATLEPELVSRAEWLRYVGVFFNKEAAANAIHADITERYKWMRMSVDQQRAIAPDAPRPVVAWVSVWSGTYTVSTAAYKADLTAGAGGALFVPADGVLTYNSAAALHAALAAQSVAAIVDETYAFDPSKYFFADFLEQFGFTAAHNTSAYPFLLHSQVFRVDARLRSEGSALDWFEDAVSNPDAVLADLASLLAHLQPSPSASVEQHGRIWFRNVAKGEGVTFIGSECSADQMSAPAAPLGTGQDAGASMVPSCPLFLTEPWRLLAVDTSSSTGGADSSSSTAEANESTDSSSSGLHLDDGAAAHAQVGVSALLLLAAATAHALVSSVGRV